MRRVAQLSFLTLCVGGALMVGAPTLRAQADEQLRQAITRYENLETNRARALFEQVVSPTTPFPVTEAQRVVAYSYLGAIQVAAGGIHLDTAKIYFWAAIGRDPLVNLEPSKFSEQERQVFATAKQTLFRVGLKPVLRDTLDPLHDHTSTISYATTHNGATRLSLASTTSDSVFTLFEGDVDGPKDVVFTGRNPRGTGFIPPGVYDVVVRGVSRSLANADDSTSSLVEIGWLREPLEDTIAALGSNDTLPTLQPSSAATRDFGLGAAVAAGAILASKLVGSSELNGSSAMSSSVAGLGLVTGIYAYMHRRAHPEIPVNVAENRARQDRRSARNAAIMARNNDRIAATKITVRPLGQ